MKDYVMKKITSLLLFFVPIVFAEPQGFVHPLKYDHSDEQTQKVVKYIRKSNIHKYCDRDSDACHPNVLELAKHENFEAFMELTAAEDKEYLNHVITEYCSTNEVAKCRYEDILKVYEDKRWYDKTLPNDAAP